MRIVTRPDFDGVVCAVILFEAENITESIKWVEPNDMQNGRIEIRPGDIIANLPYHEKCSLWFDHHYTNQIQEPFEGAFDIAPSAAGIVYGYYKTRLKKDYRALIRETDRIDSADLSIDEVMHPEDHPYVLLSMTVSNSGRPDEVYWNRLVDLLRTMEIGQVMQDTVVKERSRAVIRRNRVYKTLLQEYTRLDRHISITDFRSLDTVPEGNRFLVYSLFPASMVSVKIRRDNQDRKKIILSVGHSIFHPGCDVNVGLMLSAFNGGGHRGAGACTFHADKADEYIPQIIDILLKNKDNEASGMSK